MTDDKQRPLSRFLNAILKSGPYTDAEKALIRQHALELAHENVSIDGIAATVVEWESDERKEMVEELARRENLTVSQFVHRTIDSYIEMMELEIGDDGEHESTFEEQFENQYYPGGYWDPDH